MLTEKEYKLIMRAFETHKRYLNEDIKIKVENQMKKIKEKLKIYIDKN